MMEPGRRYNDREMAVMLRLATELESQASPEIAARTRGRTLEEIEEIAADAGIAPDTIRAAAAALGSEEQGVLARVLSAPTTFRMERVIPGELESRQLHELTDALRWELATEACPVQTTSCPLLRTQPQFASPSPGRGLVFRFRRR